MSSLNRHMKCVHLNLKQERAAQITCLLCPYKGRGLWQHYEEKHPRAEWPFACNICSSYRTFKKSLLNNHMKTMHHQGEKYRCDQCTYETAHMRSLTRHIECVHMNLKKFMCDICSKLFKEPRVLNQHLIRVHDIVLDSERTYKSILKQISKYHDDVCLYDDRIMFFENCFFQMRKTDL